MTTLLLAPLLLVLVPAILVLGSFFFVSLYDYLTFKKRRWRVGHILGDFVRDGILVH